MMKKTSEEILLFTVVHVNIQLASRSLCANLLLAQQLLLGKKKKKRYLWRCIWCMCGARFFIDMSIISLRKKFNKGLKSPRIFVKRKPELWILFFSISSNGSLTVPVGGASSWLVNRSAWQWQKRFVLCFSLEMQQKQKCQVRHRKRFFSAWISSARFFMSKFIAGKFGQ